MNVKPPPADLDPRLRPLLAAAAAEEVARRVEEVVFTHARPVVAEILSYKLGRIGSPRRTEDLEDLCGDVCVRLLHKLNALRLDPEGEAIRDLRAYAAVAAYNAFHEHLRRQYPRRHRLQNRVRYVLNHRPQLALWRGDNQEWMCGLAAWRRPAPDDDAPRVTATPVPVDTAGGGPDSDPTTLLEALFRARGRPIPLDELVDALAARWGVKDRETSLDGMQLVETRQPGPAEAVDEAQRRDTLERAWQEITRLPLAQRRALLLNLRDEDGRGCLEIFPLTGVAGIAAIAAVLEWTAGELAALWSRLPLADNDIAERLGITRQRVINLRKSARQRLARRLAPREGRGPE